MTHSLKMSIWYIVDDTYVKCIHGSRNVNHHFFLAEVAARCPKTIESETTGV